MSSAGGNGGPRDGVLYPNDLTYRFNASMAIIVVVLVTTFFFMALFVLYIRRCNVMNSPGFQQQQQQQQQQTQQQRQHGLDPESLQKLPILRYASIKSAKKGKSGPECTICLFQFEESEKIRLLPDCGHLFHAPCIDMWLETHSTCPICRRGLDQSAVSGHLQRALSAVMSSFRRDPGSNSLGEGRREDDPERGIVAAAPAPENDERDQVDQREEGPDASRRHDQGQVVRTLSRHSESFKNAVHDMELMEIRAKMRARSGRAPAPFPEPRPPAVAIHIHHSHSFAGLVPLDEHGKALRQEDAAAPPAAIAAAEVLRRSVSDGGEAFAKSNPKGLWVTGESSAAERPGGFEFSGFARRSFKWLVGSSGSNSKDPTLDRLK